MTSLPRTVSEFAHRVVTAPDLSTKLTPPADGLPDTDRSVRSVPPAPARERSLRIAPGHDVKVPPSTGMGDPAQLVRLLHAFANHELQATELFAWALLAFPEAPPAFRRGLLGILSDEQRHTRMYLARLETLGARFGDHAVTGYFWNKAHELTTPLKFICAMSLTFENANLDHTVDYAAAAREQGDSKTAAIIDRVHADEIEHVRFGWHWLAALKRTDESMWDAYRANLVCPLLPSRAIGRRFHARGREAAGMDAEFITELERITTRGRYPKWE